MALHKQVQGVGDKGGIFWAGRPTTMLALDDSLVLVQVGTVASILGAQGAVGALVQGARQMRQAKATDAAGDDMTGEEFKDQKRARVIPWDAVTSARLEGKKRSRKLTVSSNGNEAHLRYAAKIWPDDDALAFFGAHLGDRFTNEIAQA
jgi:hypothetical protein